MSIIARFVTIAAAAFVLLPGAARAQGGLDKRLSMDFRESPPAATFKLAAGALGGDVVVSIDPAVSKPVTIALRDVTLRTALNAICESIGCGWQISGSKLIVNVASPRVTSATPAGVSYDAIRALYDALEKPLPPNTRFVGLPLSRFLDEVGGLAGLLIERGAASDDPTVSVDGSAKTVKEAIWHGCTAAGLPSLTFTMRHRTTEAQKTPIAKALAGPGFGGAVVVKFRCAASAPSAQVTLPDYPNYLMSYYDGAKMTRHVTIVTASGKALTTLDVPAGVELSVHLVLGEHTRPTAEGAGWVFRGNVSIRTMPSVDIVEGPLLSQMMQSPLKLDLQNVIVTLTNLK